MKTTQTLLVAAAFTIAMLPAMPAQAADPKPLTISTVSGAVRIQQDVPCGNTLALSTDVIKGGMQMTWLPLKGGEALFDLTQVTLFLNPFHAEASCRDVRGAVDFREIGLTLAGAVRFTGEPTGEIGSGVYAFRIPRDQFLIYESVLDSVSAKQPETSYQRPAEDVTGVIDVRRQTVQLHVVLTTELHFRAGCTREGCVIDEIDRGTLTTDVRGTAKR